ncbi:unnamed protein product (macronuclear) [Paramecium tetraurelia]|uniref:Calcium-dependent protein kinase 1 n=1 Tax=Paramecium tetraurelia TaxID=5888 RepID=A0BJR0_PARTE|nr:uncharacterized protein GSPATT00029406001 [Paramecium tetraurelia]CAK58777.1 unnamed protein product [Paramecium tetraurelia]|eukprot:XP_001426175.1 hypothetical protein (macronuclear) [Paramecium tetraurelia strain d4-2]
MGSQCCQGQPKSLNYEIVNDSIKNSSLFKQSIHSLPFTNKMPCNNDEVLEMKKENEMGLPPISEIASQVIEVEKEKLQQDLSQVTVAQDPKSSNNAANTSDQQIKEGYIGRSQSTPFKRKTLTSIGTVKLGADVFISLKQGSIGKFYSTGSTLGAGAYGKVWKVTHKTTGLIRAMKQIKKSSLIQEEQQRLFAEMNILKNLDHPHIVKLYELYQDAQNYYLITEYLSGGELFERIKAMTIFNEKKAAEYMRQILSAVMYCHEQKIVHRDLKPENILFVNDSSTSPLKIIDFGTSRKYDPSKKMTKKLGTPYYIAPEVLKQDYNEKCDIWSCGVILYILLCGYPPFIGKTENEIMRKVGEGKFEFDADDWNQISKEAKNLINRMLHVNPNFRISAKQALNDAWIVKHCSQTTTNPNVNLRVLQNLQKFQVSFHIYQAKSIFSQAVLSYIAFQMTNQLEQDELLKTFQSLDKNNDGILSREELIEGYNKIYQDKEKAEQEVIKILQLIDLNQSGQVDFSEFLMAAMNQEKLVSLQKVKAAFKVFDANDDGKISKQELEQMIGTLDQDLWEQILEECNAKEFITEKEFINILLHQKI